MEATVLALPVAWARHEWTTRLRTLMYFQCL
jgi:hypothetical protein